MKVRAALPAIDTPGMEEVTAAINEKLKADGLPLEFEPMSVPQKVFTDRINMMYASGQEFEILNVQSGNFPISSLVNLEYIVPIDQYINEYGSNIKKLYSTKEDWFGCEISNNTYMVPALWKDTTFAGGECGEIGIRLDKYEEYGLEIPTTKEELFETSLELKEKWGERDAYIWFGGSIGQANIKLLRDTERYPFYVDYHTQLVLITQEGEVEPFFTSPEFKEVAEWTEKAYNAGLIHPDILTISKSEIQTITDKRGITLAGSGSFAIEAKLEKNDPENGYRYHRFFLNPDASSFVITSATNGNAISSTTSHPEAGIMFLDWLYSEQENHDLLMYGIEGKHWNSLENGRIERMKDENNSYLYDIQYWQFGNKKMRKFEEDTPQKEIDILTNGAEKREYSIALGFTFDPTPVQKEYQAVLAEIPAVIYPIEYGVQGYEQYFPAAIERLESVGYFKVVEEYERQFKEWLDA